MDFKTIDAAYRPVPFWSWNEKLNTEETRRQVDSMHGVGIGGCFMHARGGLQTPYMSEEWFDNVRACIEECVKNGMHPWAYDENGWPSGFGGGLVNGKGEAYWQKYLRVLPNGDAALADVPEHRILTTTVAYTFFYEVNPFYVDTLSHDVIAAFIREIYHPYCERFGTRFDGFFTDEPQISRNGIPWSLTLPEKYKEMYGEEIFPILPALFYPVDGYEEARVRFWYLITSLFSENFMKQIHDDCAAHGIRLTGHLVLEETLESQLTSNGACMPHYEYFDIPGMDWLCRPIYPCLTVHQLGSAAAQSGRSQVLSETFALCGHNVGQDEMKRNYEWMMVRGVNLLCQHLEGYSLRGIRKRDYPPAMYEQQPWWQDSRIFNDAMSRIGMLLAKGRVSADTLLLHNQTSAWVCFDCGANAGLHEYNDALLHDIDVLEKKHISFHLGDEILMERHGFVENGKLCIGNMAYSRVILSKHCYMLASTQKLLDAFRQAGGEILESADALAADDCIDSSAITVTHRDFDAEGFRLWYYVNSNDCEISAHISRGSYCLDPVTGERFPFQSDYTFPPYGSLLVIDDGTSADAQKAQKLPAPSLPLCGNWDVVGHPENSLTLDFCDYWFDGELQQENGCVLNVANRALALERPVNIRCRFTVQAEYIPSNLQLCLETPEKFRLTVNGIPVSTKQDCGYFCDRSFRRIPVAEAFRIGENQIELEMHFAQGEEVYQNLRNARVFESEKNKLTFDDEIEAMYLVGDFGVNTPGTFTPAARDASFYHGERILCAPISSLPLAHLEQNGFPFFAGSLTLRKVFPAGQTPVLRFAKKGINAVHVRVNGQDLDVRLWAPYAVELAPAWNEFAENTVELTLVGNLRNLLGPHHLTEGEIYNANPSSFFDEPCIWNWYRQNPFTLDYSLTESSLIDAAD